MKQNDLRKGIVLMLSSALFSCTGQLCWKLAGGERPLLFLFCGFALYGCGALLMIIALRFGDLSALHPLLGVGYILSLLLGRAVLDEQIGLLKLLGIACIVAGLLLLASSSEKGGAS